VYPTFRRPELSRSSTKADSLISLPTCFSTHRSPGMFEPINFEFSLSAQSSITLFSARTSASQLLTVSLESPSRIPISLQILQTVSPSTSEPPFLHPQTSEYSSVPRPSRSTLWDRRVSHGSDVSDLELWADHFTAFRFSRRRECKRPHPRSFGNYGRPARRRDYSSIWQRTQEPRNPLLELLAR